MKGNIGVIFIVSRETKSFFTGILGSFFTRREVTYAV